MGTIAKGDGGNKSASVALAPPKADSFQLPAISSRRTSRFAGQLDDEALQDQAFGEMAAAFEAEVGFQEPIV